LGESFKECQVKFALIVCTYMRPEPLRILLESVKTQLQYPDEIIIVDGSLNDQTQQMLETHSFEKLRYFLVDKQDRGLTRQRNYGIAKVSDNIEIVCFLDDDTILDSRYFTEILETYQKFPLALAVGGYITNEVSWEKTATDYEPTFNEYGFDGWKRTEGSRFLLRKKLGLDSDQKPGFLPEFGHGRTIGFLPPSGNVYEVEQLMGGVSSFRKTVFKDFQFSVFFDGYGLYEDTDFTLRLSKTGKLYLNTAAKLEHYHDSSGRPNKYAYGKMVVRNGWYVWRVKHPKPSIKSKFKWHTITLLLIVVRFSNTFTTAKKQEALTESLGRFASWMGLFFNKPRS